MPLLFQIIVFLFSVMAHEVSHGLVAYKLGDDTAKVMGRLNLNPLKHLDPIGSIFLPMMLILIGSPVIFGWAKPVPYNPYNLRDPKKGAAIIGAAGPATNFLIALIFGFFIRLAGLFAAAPGSTVLYSPPETGGALVSFIMLLNVVVFINILLGVFNLAPIPPFDGSKLLFAVLPDKYIGVRQFLERYSMVLLLIYIFFGLGLTVIPASYFLYNFIVGPWAAF